MKKTAPWALLPWLVCAAPACVLQSETVERPSSWIEIDDETIVYGGASVGIGTQAPTADLDVVGDVKAERYLLSDTVFFAPDQNGGGASIYIGAVEGLDVQSNGSVLIPTTLTVSGACAANCTSDARLKKNIEPLHDALGRLLRLRGVTFEWNEPSAQAPRDRGVQTGFIAQEVEAVFPEWVSEGKDGYRRLFVRGFEALAVEALRTLSTQNRDLGARLRAVEADNARLSREVQAARERDARLAALGDELAAERRARAGLEARLAALESAARSARAER
jgi:hypothetical protein